MKLRVSEDAGLRLDKWLSLHAGELSRSYVQKLIDEGRVTAGGRAAKGSQKVAEGDEIELDLPPETEPDIAPEDIPLDIMYEDEDVIGVNKPKGMVVHPAPGHSGGTLVNALMHHCGDSLSGINGVLRPGIVPRIDRDTTGLLIACKNDRAHARIAAQLKEHSITRRYRAVVCGRMKEDSGTVRGAIARHPKDRKRMTVDERRGREAVTHYRVLERFRDYTYIECRLETGRTHQIRVHMASVGRPLLGDTVYGPQRCPFSLEGQVLHAMVLGFVHPRTGEYMEYTAELPDYFRELLEKLRRIS